MTLWFVFALMTAAAIFAVLWPLGRGRSGTGGSEAAVYRDQLAEIGRDAEVGLIGPTEAGAARVEISRRLLAAADADAEQDLRTQKSPAYRRAVALLALIGVPVLAAVLYLPLGSPQLPDVPLAERSKAPSVAQPLDDLVAQVQAHLAQNPTDGRGWNVLAPVLARLGRYDEAATAFRNAITYGGDDAVRRADLGEALTAAANGVITTEAKTEFERAAALDGSEPKAQFFLGLAAEQDGRAADAAAIWGALLAKAPPEAAWRATVQAALARVGGPALPALSNDTLAAAQGMAAGDRNAMVLGMVDRLATRLKQDGQDVEGWLRLVRAYMVLGDRDKAKGALVEGRQAVGSDAAKLQQLNDGLKTFGLDG